jgi:ribosomal protein L24
MNASAIDNTPMQGDYTLVVQGTYSNHFGIISEVDVMKQSLTFFSDSLRMDVTVPISETSFYPNPAAIQHTPERAYDVVAGDTVQVVRGERLHASGPILHVHLDDLKLTFKDTPHTEVCVH